MASQTCPVSELWVQRETLTSVRNVERGRHPTCTPGLYIHVHIIHICKKRRGGDSASCHNTGRVSQEGTRMVRETVKPDKPREDSEGMQVEQQLRGWEGTETGRERHLDEGNCSGAVWRLLH